MLSALKVRSSGTTNPSATQKDALGLATVYAGQTDFKWMTSETFIKQLWTNLGFFF